MSALARRPLTPLLLFTVFLASMLFLTVNLLGLSWHPLYLFPIFFFFVVTFLLHLWQEHGFKTDPKGFVRRFMLGLVLKMFISLFVVVAMLMLIKGEHRIETVLVFAGSYLAYLTFSTVRLVNMSRNG